jgi:hypothetical protein
LPSKALRRWLALKDGDRTSSGTYAYLWTERIARNTLRLPDANPGRGSSKPQLMELDMNETSKPEAELQIVELGDAKVVTMGVPNPALHEDNPLITGQFA